MSKQLCYGQYRAEQVGEIVTLFATGFHLTTGFKTYFEPLRMLNTYALYHDTPGGFAGQMVTPFSVHIQYHSKHTIETVNIIDAKGSHTVKVEHTSAETLAADAKAGSDTLPQGVAEEISRTAAAAEDPRTAVIRRWEATGYSDTFSVEDALKEAINSLPASPPPHPDAILNVQVTSIGAEMGGYAGFHRLVVHIVASLD